MDIRAEAGSRPVAELTVEQARQQSMDMMRLLAPPEAVAGVRDVEAPGPHGNIPIRIYTPAGTGPFAMTIYYHGGGWVFGTVDEWDAVCRALAVESGCRVVSVDYRLAPEHPFPAAPDDAYDAFVWVGENLGAGRPLVVAGDSAGGNLAAVTALRVRDAGGPEIALQVLVYPVVDHDFTTGSYEQYAEEALLLNRLGMVWFWDHYAAEADRAHPYASPLRAADHSGLPPAYVLIAEFSSDGVSSRNMMAASPAAIR